VAEEVDPRVGAALDELNDSMTDVNAQESALGAARRRRKQVRAESSQRVADVERALSSSVRAAVPFFHTQAMANLYQVCKVEDLGLTV
jgi:uncharacterized membrane protein